VRTHRNSLGALAVTLVLGSAAALPGTIEALLPSDPQAAHPTYAALNLPAAWDLTVGSPRVVIAIVPESIRARISSEASGRGTTSSTTTPTRRIRPKHTAPPWRAWPRLVRTTGSAA
jgi:hypothetical protein